MKRHAFSFLRRGLVLSLMATTVAALAAAGTEQTLHVFNAFGHGGNPQASLIADAAGNLYGTASTGGVVNGGLVFKLTPSASGPWKETILHDFLGGVDGLQPMSGLIFDKMGNLYGTAYAGGRGPCSGCGIVFELSPNPNGSWTGRKLYTFGAYSTDGRGPQGNLVLDAVGNLYGTTTSGGTWSYGTVFELSPKAGGSWQESVLYSFTGGNDGSTPLAGLILDASGSLYGTTNACGPTGLVYGAVFKLTFSSGGAWTESTLHGFTGGSDGGNPVGGLVFDAAGNLYGTASSGGYSDNGLVFELLPSVTYGWLEKVLYSPVYAGNLQSGLVFDGVGNLYGTTFDSDPWPVHCSINSGCGTVFELSPTSTGVWRASVLRDFKANLDGSNPVGGLILDASGNVYGTTVTGAGQGCTWNGIGIGATGCGTVFKLTPSSTGKWTEALLYTFPGTDGFLPDDLTSDADGHLYGTTSLGGEYGSGEVFELIPSNGKWIPKMLYSFTGAEDGALPNGVTFGSDGALYGSTSTGGLGYQTGNGCGVVFRLRRMADGVWKETTLHHFPLLGTSSDGCTPVGDVALDAAGVLYGATNYGGGATCPGYRGCGTIFQLTQTANGTWNETILHVFPSSSTDGKIPTGSLVFDTAGNLYGTTFNGGTCPNFGCGTVFELSPNANGTWTESVLHNFQLTDNTGYAPNGALIFDAAGNLYGTTQFGGQTSIYVNGCGGVFELSPSGGVWSATALYAFTGSADGCTPIAGLTLDPGGNLYGIAFAGGVRNGTVFELSPSTGGWSFNLLYEFTGSTDGSGPLGRLLLDRAGKILGVTSLGGVGYYSYLGPPAGLGVVFEITP